MGEEDKAEKQTNTHINVSKFCQWLTGQSHIPLSHADRENFKIVIEFDHDCSVRYGTHTICYPVVNACTRSVTFPIAHLSCTYMEFKNVISQAITHGYEFGRIQENADCKNVQIVMEFDHDCNVHYCTHSICYPVVTVVVHPSNENYVIIYSPSCNFKP